MIPVDDPNICFHPEKILQQLIRFNTTNPPGNEKDCIDFISQLLAHAGFETKILAKDPNRPNLITRLGGRNEAPPLFLYGHVDVVTTENQQWQHPPFEGKIINGYVWGRGALDMKGGIAMMLSALLKAKAAGLKPAGDIIFAVLSDEESGGDAGAGYLVNNHPEEFSGVKYAIGEFGSCAMYVGSRKFYPIQVSEKQICWFQATVVGPGGHGAIPMQGGAMSKIAKLILSLDKFLLPPHITPVPRLMIGTIASAVPLPTGFILRQLLKPAFTRSLFTLIGDKGKPFKPLLYNTVNPTIIRGGNKINVVPSEVTLEIDGRILPGFTPSDLIDELRRVVGNDVDFNIFRFDPGPAAPDTGMFNLLSDILKTSDPTGIPMQMMLPGITDGRHFSKLNIQTYGFLPLNLPPDFNFFNTIHAADERVPVDCLYFGTDAIFELLKRYGEQR